MNGLSLHRLMPVALCAMAASAASQPSPPTVRAADPLDASAHVPALRYESALARPRSRVDDASVPWREANDSAARIGGWRAYARMAQPAATAASAVPQPVSAGPHSGHKAPGAHGGAAGMASHGGPAGHASHGGPAGHTAP